MAFSHRILVDNLFTKSLYDDFLIFNLSISHTPACTLYANLTQNQKNLETSSPPMS